jgi:hypothetical protein
MSIVNPSKTSTGAWLLVAAYAGLYVTIAVLVDSLVLTDQILERTWTLQGMVRMEDWEARRDAWRTYGYLLTPFFVLVRTGFTAVCLAVGSALLYWEVRFADLFSVSVHAEIVWAVAAVIHLTCMLYVVDVESLADFSTFYPLSALQLISLRDEDLWAVYLLKSLNLFEIAYVIFITAGMRNLIRRPLAALAAYVVLSYGGGTLLIVSGVTFLMMSVP